MTQPRPARRILESNPCPTRLNPLGAKGAGEAGTVGALPAVVNAVLAALAPLGVTRIDYVRVAQLGAGPALNDASENSRRRNSFCPNSAPSRAAGPARTSIRACWAT